MCNLTGREPSPELTERVRGRYEQIGGCSPLLEIAGELADGVAAALAAAGTPMPVEVGMRYWQPFISDAVDSLVTAGAELIVMVSLSPYEAEVTHGEYRAAVDAAAMGHAGVQVIDAPLLSAIPAFLDLQSAAAAEAMATLDSSSAPLVFSAHSLPVADVERDDSYVRGLEAAADEVASRLGLPVGALTEVLPGVRAHGAVGGARPWLVAYQSQGARGGAWLGPDLDDVIDVAAESGHTGVVVVPLGFATDHMETRYDLDVVARQKADEAGIAFVRSALPNAHATLSEGIARAIQDVVSSFG